VAIEELRRRMQAAEPKRLEAELADLDKKIDRALDLVIDLGDPGAKDRLRTLRTERERVAGELSQLRIEFPSTDELMPRLREKLREIEVTLKADVARGRLALGGLLGNQRLRVYKDGRIEGSATLSPETIAAPKRASEPRVRVVAGGRFGTCTPGLGTRLLLPWAA